MKILVGLGNPGKEYQATRHNIGFQVIDRLAERAGISVKKRGFFSLWAEGILGVQKVLLVKPQTFMNLSGKAASALVGYFRPPLGDLLVICDDFNLPLGALRLRPGGSPGGQKGLLSIMEALGTSEFSRLRVGIGTPPPEWDPADYVLSPFRKGELGIMEEALNDAAEAAVSFLSEGLDRAMSRFNRKNVKGDPALPEEGKG